HRPSREAFAQLLTADPAARILLLHGPEPEAGKTRLLEHCFARLPSDVENVLIDMKHVLHPADELFSLLRLQLAGALPKLMAAWQAQASPLVPVTGNRLIGMNNTLEVTITIDPQDARATLTEEFFADVGAFPRPLLIAIDSYERASAAAKDWVAGPFLTRVAHFNMVRVIIAGREVPQPSGRGSAYCGPVQTLEPVTQPGEWKLLIEEMGRQVGTADPDGTLVEICRALGKNTSLLMRWIEQQLPRATVPA